MFLIFILNFNNIIKLSKIVIYNGLIYSAYCTHKISLILKHNVLF